MMKRGPKPRYDALIRDGALDADPAQEDAVAILQSLYERLHDYCQAQRSWFSRGKTPPRGLYLWGGVGRGKTLLMDLFFNNADIARKRRCHFHEFMQETHQRIAAWRRADEKTRRAHKGANRKALDDPIAPIAHDIAKDAHLLCFDEFQVTDITDAMVLGRLFEALFDKGVVIIATSNRHPTDLYKDGLNRQLFLPFIDLLQEKTEVYKLASARDYRLEKLAGAPVYYHPLGPDADAAMDAAWARMLSGAEERASEVTILGRTVPVPRCARGAARFSFAELCARPLGPADYLAIVRDFGTIFIEQIPKLSPAKRDQAKRFVTLIDAIYDARAKLVCSADAEPEELYPAGDGSFEFERTVSRLREMQSSDYLAAEHVISTPTSEETAP